MGTWGAPQNSPTTPSRPRPSAFRISATRTRPSTSTPSATASGGNPTSPGPPTRTPPPSTLSTSPKTHGTTIRTYDDEANTSTRLAGPLHISPSASDTFLREALALTGRIPRIGTCLRDGVIAQAQFKQLVTLTSLIHDKPYAPAVDDAIALELRRAGAASSPRLRDMANRIIYRQDPDAIRHRREEAIRQRSAGSRPLPDGMAQIGVTGSAEDSALAMAALNDLAGSVCGHDSRSLNARRSDAAICRLQGIAFRCDCERDDCAG